MPETSRYDIDSALYNAVARGGYARLAELRNINIKNVSKYYDPHDPTYQSIFSKALLELQVIARVSPTWARGIVKVFNLFVSLWCGSDSAADSFNSDVETAATLAIKLQNPSTPDSDKMPLALELQRRANAIVAGLQFEDREDSGDKRLRQVG